MIKSIMWIFKIFLWLFQPFIHILITPIIYFIFSNFYIEYRTAYDGGVVNNVVVAFKRIADFVALLLYYVLGWYTINGPIVDWYFDGIFRLFGDSILSGLGDIFFAVGVSSFMGFFFLYGISMFYYQSLKEIMKFFGTSYAETEKRKIEELFYLSDLCNNFIPFENIYKSNFQINIWNALSVFVVCVVFKYIDSAVIEQFQRFKQIPHGVINGNTIIRTLGELPPNYFGCFFALLILFLSICWTVFAQNESSKRFNKNN